MKESAKCMLFVVLCVAFVASLDIAKLVDGIWQVVCGVVGGICAISIWKLLRSDKKCAPKAEFITEEHTHGEYSVKKTEAKYYMDVKPTDFVIKEEVDKRVRLKSDEVETDK